MLALAGYLGSQGADQSWKQPDSGIGFLAIGVILVCLVFRFLNLGRFAAPLLEESSAEPGPDTLTERIAWPIVGFAFCLGALLLLEKSYPFYFSQDDSLDSILPVMLQGCRSVFDGVFPQWDPYQFLGAPTTVLGYYGLTYPLTFVSYGIARYILQNPNATVDVLAWLHILGGFAGLYWVLRREKCRPSISMLAACCYALSGYALIFTRSFVQFGSILLWMPLLIACLQSVQQKRPGWKWIAGFGGSMGMFFHAGHIQMWVYGILFVDLAILLLILTRRLPLNRLWSCVAGHFVGLALAAPLLVPEILVAVSSVRYGDNRGIWTGLLGMFLPVSISHAPHPLDWGPGFPIGEMYYSGTLFAVIALILLIALLAMRWGPEMLGANAWFLCAVVALLLALGDEGLLWKILSSLPGFNHFRFPFKFLGFINLFMMIAGAVALERLMRAKRWRIQVELTMVMAVFGLLAYHCTLSTAAFYNFSFTPFPTPDPEITRRLIPAGGRDYPKVLPANIGADGVLYTLNVSGFRGRDPEYLDSFFNHWPTLYGVFSVDGYDPLVFESPEVRNMRQNIIEHPENALKEYGVKYFLCYAEPGVAKLGFGFTLPGARLVYGNSRVNLYELEDPRPMAFPEKNVHRALRVNFDGNGASIDLTEAAGEEAIILNMLWRPQMRATAGGDRSTVEPDAWGRLRIRVPRAVSTVRVEYRPPWGKGIGAALVLFGAGCLLGWIAGRSEARISQVEVRS